MRVVVVGAHCRVSRTYVEVVDLGGGGEVEPGLLVRPGLPVAPVEDGNAVDPIEWIGCRLCRPCRNRLPLRLLVLAEAAVSRNRDFKIRGYTVGQAPNLPLIVVIVAAVVGRITEQGSVPNRIADSVFFVSLSIWSYLETFDGVNAFRRVLGIAGFVVVLTRLVGQLQ